MDLAPFTTRKAALKCWVWAGASSPAPVGKARRGAPWAGGSGNGVDRPGPPPASSPSGGSGRGVGLGEVLQGPGGPPPRPAVVRVRLGAAAALLVVPCRGRTAWRSGPVVPAQARGPWTGARWPRAASVVGWWARRVPPRAPLLGGRRPPLRSSAPRHAPVAPVRPHAAPVKDGSLTASLTQTPACSTARPRLLPRRCGHCGRGALVVGAGPWARIAPGGGSRGRRGPCGARAPSADWTTADCVGGLRGLSRPRSEAAPIVDARRWPIRAPSCPGVQAADHRIQAARVGTVPPALPAAVPSEPARHRGGHRSRRAPPPRSTVLAVVPFLVLGRADGADPAPPRIPDDRSVQRPARVPGPLFERSGQQAISPIDHRPRPNRSARTSRPTPHRNATAPPHPRPPTLAITSSVITYRSSQIKGIHRQLNTPRR